MKRFVQDIFSQLHRLLKNIMKSAKTFFGNYMHYLASFQKKIIFFIEKMTSQSAISRLNIFEDFIISFFVMDICRNNSLLLFFLIQSHFQYLSHLAL